MNRGCRIESNLYPVMYGETHIAIRIWCPMTVLQNSYSIKRFHNEAIAPPGDYATDPGAFISPEAFDSARREISGWPGYTPTPLLSLGGMAGALGIASLHLKYEAPRFGLGSFKALGGAYAVSLYLRRVIRERTGEDVDTQSLLWSCAVRRLAIMAVLSPGARGCFIVAVSSMCPRRPCRGGLTPSPPMARRSFVIRETMTKRCTSVPS